MSAALGYAPAAAVPAWIAALGEAVHEERAAVLNHPLYRCLDSLPRVRAFLEVHVFAVWDYMSLLKSLQMELTCVRAPWVPVGRPAARRLINELVLAEESDVAENDFASHFELYLAAMDQAGADRGPVTAFVQLLQSGHPVPWALVQADAPAPAVRFLGATRRFIDQTPLHCRAAAFAFGRVDLVPAMFERLGAIPDPHGALPGFKDHLVRHVRPGAEARARLAVRMVDDLVGTHPGRRRDCVEAARAALIARAELWDGVLEQFRGPIRP